MSMRVLLICNYKPGVGGISGQVELLQRHLRAEGHEAEIFSTKGSRLWRLGLFRRLGQVAKAYDVLHIHCCSGWGFLPAVVGVTVGRWRKRRIVLTYHGGGGERFFDRHPRLVRHYLTRTDANIVLSGFLAQTFEKHQITYIIVPNMLEMETSNYRERTVLHPRFICVRSHEELYNIPCVLRAFGQLQAQIPEATLTLVGDGTQHERLVQLTAQLGLNNVTFTGRVDNREIFRYLDRADILLSAPKIDNMPVSLLEAMHAGLLVISSNVGGVPFIIRDGENGLLFRSDQAGQLAEKMAWALAHQTETKALVLQAKTDVAAYRWENIRTKLFALYGIPA